MGYNNKPNLQGNQNRGGFGIAPYDYISMVYDSQNDLTDAYYYRGGQGSDGDLIAHIQFTYDSSGNLESAERLS